MSISATIRSGFVISLNLKRRHLNESQRAMIAARLAKASVGNPNLNRANLPDRETTNAQAASLVNVSERSVKTAKQIQDRATPELAQAVDRGDIPVSSRHGVFEHSVPPFWSSRATVAEIRGDTAAPVDSPKPASGAASRTRARAGRRARSMPALDDEGHQRGFAGIAGTA